MMVMKMMAMMTSIIKLHGTKVHDELGGWQALNTRRVRPFNVYVYWS